MIRRDIGELWPKLSRQYGLHPWDLDRLTEDELLAYVEQLER